MFLQLQGSWGWADWGTADWHCPYCVITDTYAHVKYTHILIYTHICMYIYTCIHHSFFLAQYPLPFSASLLLFCTHHLSPSSLPIITIENSPPGEEFCIRALSHQVCLGLIKSFLSRAIRGGTFKDLAPGFGPGKGVWSLALPWSLASSLIPPPLPLCL